MNPIPYAIGCRVPVFDEQRLIQIPGVGIVDRNERDGGTVDEARRVDPAAINESFRFCGRVRRERGCDSVTLQQRGQASGNGTLHTHALSPAARCSYSFAAPNVSHCSGSPESNPLLNQRTRCADVPCVNDSGVM